MRIKLLIGLTVVACAVVASYAVNSRPRVPRDSASPSGMIMGRVLDAQESPVSGAEVMASSESGSAGRLPIAYTDEQGVFQLKNLRADTYRLSVAKEEDGYPDTGLSLYSDGTLTQRVTLNGQQTISDITLRLGAKAAKLTGRIHDLSTNRPIRGKQDVQIILMRVDDPSSFFSTGPDVEGNFSILVPSVPFTMEVSVPGYKRWTNNSGVNAERRSAIQMTPGEENRLTIALEPNR